MIAGFPARRLRRWLRDRLPGRPFEALQIEVTTRCSLRCAMCPRTALGAAWPELDLPWATFVRADTVFPRVRHVHLQGWGEPLLHPRLPDMVAAAKAAGCRVGLTTNGALLTREAAGRLLDAGLDLLAVSIAGATPETHARIRVGSELPVLLQNVSGLLARREAGRPRVELSYLMTRANLSELPAAVALAGRLGVDELYAINLDWVMGPEQERLAAFGADAPSRAPVLAAEAAARRLGIAFRAYPTEADERAVCEANPLRALFLAADSSISPCSYHGLSGRTELPRRFLGQPAVVPRLCFGSLLEQELLDIWESPPYRAFRRRFAERRLGLGLAVAAGAPAEDLTPAVPAPEACRSCHKLYGL